MSDEKRLLKRAEQLEQLAHRVSPDDKRQLLDIAREWREIAARVARSHGADVLEPSSDSREDP